MPLSMKYLLLYELYVFYSAAFHIYEQFFATYTYNER